MRKQALLLAHATVLLGFAALPVSAETPATAVNSAFPATRPAVAAPPTPRPAAIKPKDGRWPLVAWSYAKAFTYNVSARGEAGADQPEARNVARLLSPEGVWNDQIRSERLLTRKMGERAADLVNKARGAYVSSKCPFTPRHAVAYFDERDHPVAVVEVCFECGDLVSWPKIKLPKGTFTSEGQDSEAYMRDGEAAIEAFKSFFAKDLGEPLKWTNVRPSPPR